jgi:uncharacterized cupredoxin-like copper-binding protein
MRMKLIALAAATLLSSQAALAQDWITDGAAIVKAADWNKMQTVTVTMEEHHYTPTEMKLKAGQPYKIELKNIGEKDHYYTAPEFFKSVAWRKLMVNKNAEIKVDYVTATEVLKKGGQLDLYIVPVKKGSYTVYCTIDDHREKGMEGKIIVE